MLTDITFLAAFELITCGRLVLEETLIPADCPPMSNSPYRPGYDWLFYYERKLARVLDKWLQAYRLQLIGENGIISEALSNAFYHGHQKDPRKPIQIKLFVGTNGLMLKIADQGRGFDVPQVLGLLQQQKNYYHAAGNGLRVMAASPHFAAFFDDGGTSFQLLYLTPHDYASVLNLSVIPPLRTKPRKTSGPVNIKRQPDGTASKGLHQWAQGAILVGPDLQIIAYYGLNRSVLADIVAVCFDVYSAALSMCQQVDIGFPKNVWVNSDRTTFVIKKFPQTADQWLIIRLSGNANPAQATLYLPQLYQSLAPSSA